MSRRKEIVSVYLETEQMTELRALHARTRVPMAEYIRQGLDMVLAKNRTNEIENTGIPKSDVV